MSERKTWRELASVIHRNSIDSRLAKIEERLERAEADAACIRHENAELKKRIDAIESNGHDVSTKCRKPEPSSGAEAVYKIPSGIGGHGRYPLYGQCLEVYRAAVAHYRRTVPHLTLKEIRNNYKQEMSESCERLHAILKANREDPE